MFVYVTLNTMIWTVVHFSNGKITPTNYHEKEVYNWAMGKRDMPTWMRKIAEKISFHRQSEIGRKETVDLADTDSTIRNSSQNGSAEGKDAIMLEPNPQHRHTGHSSAYQR